MSKDTRQETAQESWLNYQVVCFGWIKTNQKLTQKSEASDANLEVSKSIVSKTLLMELELELELGGIGILK